MNMPLRKPMMNVIPVPECPCCGHAIPSLAELQWNAAARTLTGRGLAIIHSRQRAKIFDALWPSLKSGRRLSRDQMMSVVYGDDPSGGPESENIISIQVMHLKKAIAPFGLSISGRQGYSLISRGQAAE